MNDTRRKMLTEYLGECWHEPVGINTVGMICSCGLRFYDAAHEKKWNRTFDTAQDMVDLVKKIGEKKEWIECKRFMHLNYGPDTYGVTAWLITDPARTCELIAEWMEGKHGHDNKDA